MSETENTPAAAEAPAPATKKKAAKKKAKAPVAKKMAKKKAKVESNSQRGRTPAFAGKKIYKLVKADDAGLRSTGKVREYFDSIREGMTVEKFREAAPDVSVAQALLRGFVAKKLVKVA